MNPIIAGLINIIPGVVNSIGNLIKDKKKGKDGKLIPELVKDELGISKGIEISSKVVVGYGLGGTIIAYTLSQPMDKLNLIAMAIGAIIIIVTTVAKIFEK